MNENNAASTRTDPLKDFPLHEHGDLLVAALKAGGVDNPAIVILAVDGEGHVSSTGNIAEAEQITLLNFAATGMAEVLSPKREQAN